MTSTPSDSLPASREAMRDAMRVPAPDALVKHNHKKDEVLEALWTMREDGLDTLADLAARVHAENLDAVLGILVDAGRIERAADTFKLTAAGKERAEAIIRRHRLAERLFSDVFGLDEPQWEASACSFEHILDETVVEAVCTFLGHPPVCPHEKQIPPGACCRAARRPSEPLVIPLKEMKVGGSAKIIFITPRTKTRLSRLASYGVIPGYTLLLQQRFPSYVIRIDQTEVALESEIAKEIFVRPDGE